MYKNFKISEKEKKQILEMHQSFGSPKQNKYNWENPLWEELTNTNDGSINGETVISRIIELSKEGKFSDDELSDVGLQAILMVHENSHNGSYGSGPEPMGY